MGLLGKPTILGNPTFLGGKLVWVSNPTMRPIYDHPYLRPTKITGISTIDHKDTPCPLVV